PTYFHKPVSALVGHGGAVVRPAGCKYLNYEGEVAIVIGRACRGVPPPEAGEYIAGYTIANDFGLHDFRDTDAGSMLRVKGSDTMAPLGRGLVTGWDFHGKRLRTYVNGRLAQDGSTDEMQWDMHYLVADVARTITLYPGDVLLSGTPANSRPVQPGDVVEVAVDGLGTLVNHIVEGPESIPDEYGAQPTASGEVLSTALGGDWGFRGVRAPARTEPAAMNLHDWLRQAVSSVEHWQSEYPPFETHPSLRVSDERFAAAFGGFAERMRGNYPYFHPLYAGQMLKPPHPAAVAGYVAAMLVNPNNHALDGGKVTSEMEEEVVAELAAIFGMQTHLGHLTSSGTIANLEALYVARELHPDRGIAYSADAHYTHARMCGVLGMAATAVRTDAVGRIDLDALDELLAGGTIGTVVATAGTTGLGAIDPVHDVLAIARPRGVRVHVDAAYGGFFTLLAGAEGRTGLDPRPWQAIAGCDSVVVDPHKHG